MCPFRKPPRLQLQQEHGEEKEGFHFVPEDKTEDAHLSGDMFSA
jgi:hypothetical protein